MGVFEKMQWRFAQRTVAPVLAVAVACAPASLHAETAVVAPAETPPAAVPALIPALTPIEIELGADLGSKLSKSGDRFPLTLKNAVVIDGRELLPAGTAGEGEVVHAKKAGWGGAPGELVLAARFLTVDGRQLRLRSLRFDQVGDDKIRTVAVSTAVTSALLGPLGAVGAASHGGDLLHPKGSPASAKTAEAFEITPSAAAPPAAEEIALPTDRAEGPTLQPQEESPHAEISS